MNRDDLVTRPQAIVLLGISETTMKRWMRDGKVQPASIRVSNGKVRQYWFRRSYIESLLQKENRSES